MTVRARPTSPKPHRCGRPSACEQLGVLPGLRQIPASYRLAWSSRTSSCNLAARHCSTFALAHERNRPQTAEPDFELEAELSTCGPSVSNLHRLTLSKWQTVRSSPLHHARNFPPESPDRRGIRCGIQHKWSVVPFAGISKSPGIAVSQGTVRRQRPPFSLRVRNSCVASRFCSAAVPT